MKVKTTSNANAFTLVEIMVVVVVIGLLSALAIPSLKKVQETSRNTRFASDMRSLSHQLEIFILESGHYPEDSNSGEIPSGFEEYIQVNDWNAGPTIGGVYDVELNSHGITSGIGVHRYTISDVELTRFDRKFDDGDLATGSYRKIHSDRYYLVVAE